MPKKVRPGSKRLPPWQTPQTQCRGSYSRKMSKKGVFEQAKDTFSPLNQISDETKRRGSFIKVNRAGEGAGIIYLYTIIKVNKARENAGIIYIHQSHRSRRGRHVYMISMSTRSSTTSQKERPCGHLSSEEWPPAAMLVNG